MTEDDNADLIRLIRLEAEIKDLQEEAQYLRKDIAAALSRSHDVVVDGKRWKVVHVPARVAYEPDKKKLAELFPDIYSACTTPTFSKALFDSNFDLGEINDDVINAVVTDRIVPASITLRPVGIEDVA